MWRRRTSDAAGRAPGGRPDPRATVPASLPAEGTGGSPDGSADGTGALWSPGDTVAGLYEVGDVLGQGMTGVVHRVRHLAWNTERRRPGTSRRTRRYGRH